MSPTCSGIIVAPFSNSEIRDWPIGHYAELIGHLLDGPLGDEPIRVIGTPNQRLGAAEIVRRYPATRVANTCGRLPWHEVIEALKVARCVIGNNSGVAHLGGHFGVATVCVFGGSHQRGEWHPRGPGVIVVSRVIGCSPCQLDHGSYSPYDKACLREIVPSTVADAALRAVRLVERKRGEQVQ